MCNGWLDVDHATESALWHACGYRRHATLSRMADNGVPDTVVSAWAGHTELSFTKRVCVHPDPQSLKAGSEKLGELLG